MTRSSRHTLTLTVVAVTIVAGCAAPDPEVPPAAGALGMPLGTLGAPKPSYVDPKDAEAALNDPSIVAELRALALKVSSRAGVPSPNTMVAVLAADHQAAEAALGSGPGIPDHAPVYVISMTGGTFTATRHPPGATAPQSNVLTLTVDAATHRITDTGYIGEEPDLKQFGPVRDLLPSVPVLQPPGTSEEKGPLAPRQ